MTNRLTEERVKSLLLNLAVGKSYQPRLRQTDNACRKVTEKWGRWTGGGIAHAVFLQRLMQKILRERSFGNFSETELECCPEVLMQGAENYPPIWNESVSGAVGSATFLDELIAEIAKRNSHGALDELIGMFFFRYPKVPFATYDSLRKAVINDSVCHELFMKGFFSSYENAPKEVALKIPDFSSSEKGFYEDFADYAQDVIASGARFTQDVWKNRISSYAGALSSVFLEDGKDLDSVLAQIKKDACIEGTSTLACLDNIEVFADGLLTELENKTSIFKRIPTETEGQKIYVFLRDIGKLTDESSDMKRIKNRLDALFENWKTGRTLFVCVDFINDFLEDGRFWDLYTSNTTLARQWRGRMDFWTDFWRQGRVRESFVYLSQRSQLKLERSSVLRAKYPNTSFVKCMRYSDSHDGFKPYLVMIVDDKAVIEASFNGSVRICPADAEVLKGSQPNWYGILRSVIRTIPHNPTVWKSNVLSALR